MTPTPSLTAYILIADNSEPITESLRSLARDQALDTLVVTDGEAAVSALHGRGVPRLMVVNLSLPKLDGFSVIAELRKLATAERCPVVASSSFGTLRGHATRLQSKLGIAAVVTPTLDVAHLDQVFREALVVTDPIMFIDLDDPAESVVREEARLAELEKLVDVQPSANLLEPELAAIAQQFGVSTVLVTLVQRDHVVFKAVHGLPPALAGRQTISRNQSFCRHVVESNPPAPLIVPDAVSHPAFSDHPLVLAGVIGSYVGVPLTSPSGNVLGTLCLVDRLPWLGSAALVDALTDRARQVTASLLEHCEERCATWSRRVTLPATVCTDSPTLQ
jgi:CheY-like chemotaxis protein